MAIRVKIREDLHKIIDQVEDEKILEAVYVLLERELRERENFTLNTAQIEELDSRIERHKNGETKSYSWEEALQRIRSGL